MSDAKERLRALRRELHTTITTEYSRPKFNLHTPFSQMPPSRPSSSRLSRTALSTK